MHNILTQTVFEEDSTFNNDEDEIKNECVWNERNEKRKILFCFWLRYFA